jgi:hypothetical protein
MPWEFFECPDGEKIKIEACCEKGGCRMTERCVSRPTCILFSRSRRAWKGKISTTQALNGTRLAYLQIVTPFSERPCDRAFALLGTFHHMKHQKLDLPDALMEEGLEDSDSTGIFDFYEEEDGVHEMLDYKTAGAWKIVRLQGKYKIDVPTGEFFKSGPRKGQEKTRTEWGLREPDDFDLRMQCSRYAWMMRDMGYKVDRYKAQFTIRDFMQSTAKNSGLDRQIYMFPVTLFDRETVVSFYQARNKALCEAVEKKEMPPVCSEHERWRNDKGVDVRCARFCPVWTACDWGRQARATPLPKNEEEA